jgi:hypothetical protein
MRIDINSIPKWGVAKKVKGIKAKPLINLLVDRTVTSKFLVDTLEGKEPLGDGVVICIGEANDAWQQMPSKLIAKYDIVDIDKDGWMICTPKQDANSSVNFFEITDAFTDSLLNPDIHPNRQQDGNYYIIGQYGEKHDDGLRQNCVVGDFICQNRTDTTDVWIVRRKLFINTYAIIGE